MSKLIVANWKMYLSPKDSVELFGAVAKKSKTVICSSFIALNQLSALAKKSGIGLGAQDCFWDNRGAYTGEVSPLDLKDLGCEYVIVGHSERRNYFKETDKMVGKKVKAALVAGLTPILCVGENESERKKGKASARVEEQLEYALDGLGKKLRAEQWIIIAYEPVWAIGTGNACDPETAVKMHQMIKEKIAKLISVKNVRVLYGGSVDDKNIASYLKNTEIDGALVGGASTKKDVFMSLLAVAAKF
ncbi:MAG: triose-phosphate isomerase [Candidatus Magasanikbacteria bacterium]|nr:triose-phosphate isomerase [Candidatus Magasanikbacteria bacterium]